MAHLFCFRRWSRWQCCCVWSWDPDDLSRVLFSHHVQNIKQNRSHSSSEQTSSEWKNQILSDLFKIFLLFRTLFVTLAECLWSLLWMPLLSTPKYQAHHINDTAVTETWNSAGCLDWTSDQWHVFLLTAVSLFFFLFIFSLVLVGLQHVLVLGGKMPKLSQCGRRSSSSSLSTAELCSPVIDVYSFQTWFDIAIAKAE